MLRKLCLRGGGEVGVTSAGGAGTGGAVVHVSSNRYERVQAAAAHGMLASMSVIGAAGRIPAGGVANDANLQIQADDGMMAKQPRYAQRKRPLREVKGEKTK